MFEKFSNLKILVTGDVMLDQYWFGDVARISPEAPVPICKINKSEIRLGGAANVAANLAALGVQTSLLSILGTDEAACNIQKLAQKAGIQTLLHTDKMLATIVKLRVIGRGQQLLRIDFETSPSQETLSAKFANFKKEVSKNDLIVLSDYGKGALLYAPEMIAICKEKGKAIFIDPKGDDYEKYRGATLITPNRQELESVVGKWHSESDLEQRAQKLRESLEIEALLVTRSEEGMSLFTKNGVLHQKAQEVREVFDVSGAGDTVIATIAATRAAGATWQNALHWATLAAGVVIGKLGTAVITPQELQTLIN